ncbi:ECF transporter S component [Loigolactobacillus zhaoyuanensis]|uniref:ECF transporter S component n=1 Tax=Loigolactobacillus zhaoyuanensis TaxID=2486017 RepID=A0ABW8UDK8_9LACO|nr:ECF transporter S component [Loigolactobacillus zhaoyuanensis]
MQQSRNTLRAIILTGLFAAIIFIGISLLRIPIPALVGRPFIHFGNALTVLAILFLGGRNGAFAGIIGLGGFDLLNGYAATSWLTALEVIVVAVVVNTGFKLFRYDDRVSHIVTLGIVAGITKIFTTYAVSIVEALMVGTSFKVALINSFLSLPATVINSISTAIIVPILYFALRGSLRGIQRRA